MPLQILQKGPSAMQGALLGLGQGLQELAANKLAAMRQANEQAQFAKTLREANFEPGVANLISALPIEQRLKALSPYLQDPNFMANRGAQAQTAVQPVIPEAVVQEPTIHAAAQQQQFRELAGQKGQQQQPQLPSSFDMAQEVRRNALGFPETFTPESVKELIKQFEGFGHQFSPQQRANIEQQAADIMQNPQKMAALQQQYDQAVKNNETMELRRPGYTGQAVPLQQLQQPGQPLYRQPVKPLTEFEKATIKKADIAERAEQRAIYKEIKPLLDEQAKDFKNATQMYEVASRALNNIEKNKKKWPVISGYLPEKLHRDPDVRNYIRDLNKIVDLGSESIKGNATNYKVALKRSTKVDLTEPIESQIQGLKNILGETKRVFDTQDIINNIKNQYGGDRFPIDLAQRITNQIGRPDIIESEQLAPGAKLTDIDISKLPNGYPLNGPDGKKYVWDAAQKKPVLAGFGGK